MGCKCKCGGFYVTLLDNLLNIYHGQLIVTILLCHDPAQNGLRYQLTTVSAEEIKNFRFSFYLLHPLSWILHIIAMTRITFACLVLNLRKIETSRSWSCAWTVRLKLMWPLPQTENQQQRKVPTLLFQDPAAWASSRPGVWWCRAPWPPASSPSRRCSSRTSPGAPRTARSSASTWGTRRWRI